MPIADGYLRLGKQILTRNLKGLWSFGTVGMTPTPIIIKNSLANTPKDGIYSNDYGFWAPYRAEQWFFKN